MALLAVPPDQVVVHLAVPPATDGWCVSQNVRVASQVGPDQHPRDVLARELAVVLRSLSVRDMGLLLAKVVVGVHNPGASLGFCDQRQEAHVRLIQAARQLIQAYEEP